MVCDLQFENSHLPWTKSKDFDQKRRLFPGRRPKWIMGLLGQEVTVGQRTLFTSQRLHRLNRGRALRRYKRRDRRHQKHRRNRQHKAHWIEGRQLILHRLQWPRREVRERKAQRQTRNQYPETLA